MLKIVPIVEGDGETTAAPVLFHKLLKEMRRHDVQVAPPKNAHGRDNLLKPDGVEKFVKHAWKERECGAIVILLDAEGDCPEELAKEFSRRIETIGIIHPVAIVCAKRMYETWFLASIETIAGKNLGSRPGLTKVPPVPTDVESIKSPKNWLESHFPQGRSYKETQDQEAMTKLLDTSLARERSRSFRRLCHALEEALAAMDGGAKVVTPSFSGDVGQPRESGPTAVRKRSLKRKA